MFLTRLCNHNYELTMRRGAIHTARIIDFPRRISIARAPAKPWTFICNLMNDNSDAKRGGFARLENSEFDSVDLTLARARRHNRCFWSDQKSNYRFYEFSFSPATHYKHFARIDSRFSTDDSSCSHRASFVAASRENSLLNERGRKRHEILAHIILC